MRLLTYILLFLTLTVRAQESAPGFEIDCPVNDNFISKGNINTFRIRSDKAPTSRFSVTYENVPQEVKDVVEEGLNIWSRVLMSRIPIKVKVSWEDLSVRTLAVTGSDRVYKNFKNAPQKNVWYPSALANAISSETNNPDYMDINLKINSRVNWDYWKKGSSAQGVTSYDLLTVVLHEIAHGIGFICSFDDNNGSDKIKWGIDNNPYIFDKFIVSNDEISLVNERFFTNNSKELKDLVTSEKVYFKINHGFYSQNFPELYTPATFNNRGSLSHFAIRDSIIDRRDKLMYPTLSSEDQIHHPGDATIAILFEIGWDINEYEFSHNYPVPTHINPLNLYPNPADGSINLALYDYKSGDESTFIIYDIWGRAIEKGSIEEQPTQLNISGFIPGLYYVRHGQFSSPFIKL